MSDGREATGLSRPRPWRLVYWIVLAAGFVAVLALSWPGQMSFDSVMQLYEGRTNHQLTFNPWIMSWLMGLADRAVPGAALFMLLTQLVLFAALAALPALRGRVAPWGVVALAAVLATPQIVNYQGIVWKDVVFANLVVAGFVALALALRWKARSGPRIAAFGATVALLAVAALVRQNGLIAAVLAALALAVAEGARLGWKKAAVAGLAGFAAIMALAFVLGAVIRPGQSDLKANATGLVILQQYDIVGAVARDPAFDLSRLPPENAATIREQAPKVYSVQRIDGFNPTIGAALWHSPRPAFTKTWQALVLHRPGLYLKSRLEVFNQVFATPRLLDCLPVQVGVEAPAAYLDKLSLKRAPNAHGPFLSRYAAAFYGTPVFSHIAYAVLSLALIAALALRRAAADVVVIGLLLAGLGFAASFFVISLACDYRYLYLLDLSALVGLVYWAMDPPALLRARA